jgi:hypothetical protein
VTAHVPLLLAPYCGGIWKSPVNTPVLTPVSTRVNPEFAKPSVTPLSRVELQVESELLEVSYKNNHCSSSMVMSSNLPKLSPTEF